MGDYDDAKKELRSIRNGCICCIFFEIIISVALYMVIKRPCVEFIFIVMKYWCIAFWISCIISNLILIYKANVAIKNPEKLLDVKW
jgi:hypothetical protein